MKITEEVRKYAAEIGVAADKALDTGLQEKAQEFAASGGDIYR
jgi:phosphomethylpyrimidine synthase